MSTGRLYAGLIECLCLTHWATFLQLPRLQRSVDQVRLPLVYLYHNVINPLPPACLFHIDLSFHITNSHISSLNPPMLDGLFVFQDYTQDVIFLIYLFCAQFWMKLLFLVCLLKPQLKSFSKIPSILLFAGRAVGAFCSSYGSAFQNRCTEVLTVRCALSFVILRECLLQAYCGLFCFPCFIPVLRSSVLTIRLLDY